MRLPTTAVCSEVEPQHREHTSARTEAPLTAGCDCIAPGIIHYMKPTPLDLTEIVESGTKGD